MNRIFLTAVCLSLAIWAIIITTGVVAAEPVSRVDCDEITAMVSPSAPGENLYNGCSDIRGDIYNPGDGKPLQLRDNAGEAYAYVDDSSRVRYLAEGWRVGAMRDVEELRYRVGVTAYTNFVKHQGHDLGVHRNASTGTIHGTMRWAWHKINRRSR